MNISKSVTNPVPCTPDRVSCWRTHLFPLLLLFVILSIIYANSFNGAWVFDDHQNITHNPHVHLMSLDWESVKTTFYSLKGDISRPLSYLSFGLNHYFHGLDTWGYHLVNFIIHFLGSVFLYLFVFKTLHLPIMKGRYADRAGTIALLAAILWATAPIHVTAVTVIVQRMASMAGMFFIMSMFFYLMGRITPGLSRQIAWFGLCLGSGLLAFAAKENAILLLPTLFLFDVLLIQGLSRQNLKRNLLVAAIPLGIIVVLAFVMANPIGYLTGEAYAQRDFTPWERLMTQPRVLFFYLTLMIYPIAERFTLIYEIPVYQSMFFPWTTIPAIMFWTAWVAVGAYLAPKRPLISFCLLFFVVNHLVESTIIPLEMVYEHRNYIPSMALYMLASVGIIAFLKDFSQKRTFLVLACLFIVIVIAGQGHAVFQRNSLFAHPLYLWHDNAAKSPGLSRVHTNLGTQYLQAGLHEEAKQASLMALQLDNFQRIDLPSVPLHNLGIYHLRAGNYRQALRFFEKTLAVDSREWEGYQGAATALNYLGRYEEAKKLIEVVFASQPTGNPELRALYSLVLFKLGDHERAIEESYRVINAGGDPIVYKVLGEAFAATGDPMRAAQYWNTYVRINPGDMEGLFALVYRAWQAGDKESRQRAAAQILVRKENRTWAELVKQQESRYERNLYVLTENPSVVLPLIKQSLASDLEELEQIAFSILSSRRPAG